MQGPGFVLALGNVLFASDGVDIDAEPGCPVPKKYISIASGRVGATAIVYSMEGRAEPVSGYGMHLGFPRSHFCLDSFIVFCVKGCHGLKQCAAFVLRVLGLGFGFFLSVRVRQWLRVPCFVLPRIPGVVGPFLLISSPRVCPGPDLFALAPSSSSSTSLSASLLCALSEPK